VNSGVSGPCRVGLRWSAADGAKTAKAPACFQTGALDAEVFSSRRLGSHQVTASPYLRSFVYNPRLVLIACAQAALSQFRLKPGCLGTITGGGPSLTTDPQGRIDRIALKASGYPLSTNSISICAHSPISEGNTAKGTWPSWASASSLFRPSHRRRSSARY
jgi:hypothetical protein